MSGETYLAPCGHHEPRDLSWEVAPCTLGTQHVHEAHPWTVFDTFWCPGFTDVPFNGPDLLFKLEDEGLDDHEEAIFLAEWLLETGLVNSTGSYQRFVQEVLG